MGKKICLLFILPFIIGFTNQDKRFDDIEFIAYNWRYDKMENKWKFCCNTYVLIENMEQCKLILERYYPTSEIKYCRINISKEIINDVIVASENIEEETDLRPKFPQGIYDGPSLKIRINKNNKSKIIHFYDNGSKKATEFIKLYKSISNSIVSKKYNRIKTNDYLKKRKQDFVNLSMKSDTIIRPLPKILFVEPETENEMK